MLKYSEISKEAFMLTVYFSLGLSVICGIVIIWAESNNMPSDYIQMWVVGWVIMVSLSIVVTTSMSYVAGELYITEK